MIKIKNQINKGILALGLLLCLFLVSSCQASNLNFKNAGFTIIYSWYENMLSNPTNYYDKPITIKGMHRMQNGKHIITDTDSSLCCTWSIEFKITDNDLGYPIIGKVCTVLGVIVKSNSGNKFYIKASSFE